MYSSFEQLKYDNSFVRSLPGDPETQNFRRQVQQSCYSRVEPTEVAAPLLVALSPESAALLDLDVAALDEQAVASVLSGNHVVAGMDPYASCYGGHQFGHWAGQLGDGRAISLGEVVNQGGERWELQLKGAGPTPYSRQGDGRAVMRSSVREFLCSESMYHLGVPTTRALSLVGSGEAVVRDMFYTGHPKDEPGAIVCRMSPTFIRFGSFEIFASRRDVTSLKTLADYTITTHFPELGTPSQKVYAEWMAEMSRRSAHMVLEWLRVGFVHGVMNTDNMSVLGLTIDYGPYGWLEGFEPGWTPNTTDAQGRRYCFGNQPQIAYWNVVRMANAIAPLVDDVGTLEEAVSHFQSAYATGYAEMMAQKLGIAAHQEENSELIDELLKVLQLTETDMTIFYRKLADVSSNDGATDDELLEPVMSAYYDATEVTGENKERIVGWLRQYTARLREEGRSDEVRAEAMNLINPKYVLRNYLAQLAIDEAEKGDGSKVIELLDVMRRPYDEQPDNEQYAEKRPEWARNRPGCSMLSCSS